MKPARLRPPKLQGIYRRYLQDAIAATFIREVSQSYSVATLERMAESGSRQTRRAATMALGFVGDFRSNEILGRRLRDADRGVRLLADTGLREVWCRDGSEPQQLWLRKIQRLVHNGEFARSLEESTRLLAEAPTFAEVWNQRAVAHFNLNRLFESIDDGRTVLELNPCHFAAAADLGQCYLRLGNAAVALECFSLAVRLNPDLARIRAQLARVRRKLNRGS